MSHLLSYEPFVNNISIAMLKEVASLKNPTMLCWDKGEEITHLAKSLQLKSSG